MNHWVHDKSQFVPFRAKIDRYVLGLAVLALRRRGKTSNGMGSTIYGSHYGTPPVGSKVFVRTWQYTAG